MSSIEIGTEYGVTSYKQHDPPEAHVRIALAGYAAVGACLGDDAEAQNRATEHEPDGKTDLEQASEQALLGRPGPPRSGDLRTLLASK